MKKIELHVGSIHDERSQTKVMKAITKLQGVDEVSVNKEKRIITIKGDVDPVKLVKQIRKSGHFAEILSVGPPAPPPKPPVPPPKPVEKPTPPPPLQQPPCYCNQCHLVAVAYDPPYDHNRDVCSIL